MSLKTCIGKTRFAGIKPEFAHLRIDVETGNAMEALAEKYQKRTKNPLSQDAAEKAVVQKYLDAAIKERQGLSDQIRELQGMPAPAAENKTSFPSEQDVAENIGRDAAAPQQTHLKRGDLDEGGKERGQWELVNAEKRTKLVEYLDAQGEAKTKQVADMDNAETSYGSGIPIANIFWLKSKITGETKPFGVDTAPQAMGMSENRANKKFDEAVWKSQDEWLKNELSKYGKAPTGDQFGLLYTNPKTGKQVPTSITNLREWLRGGKLSREQVAQRLENYYGTHEAKPSQEPKAEQPTAESKIGGYPVSGLGDKALTAYLKSSNEADRIAAQAEIDRRAKVEKPVSGEGAQNEPKFSQSSTPARNPFTLSTLATAIDKAMGQGFTKLLEATGKFKIISSVEADLILKQTPTFKGGTNALPGNSNGATDSGHAFTGLPHANSKINVPLNPELGRGSVYPVTNKGGSNGVLMNAQRISNILETPAFKIHGFGGLEIEAKNSVLTQMLLAGQDRKILDSVISLIPIDVMNVLRDEQLAPQVLLHDKAVLLDALTGNGVFRGRVSPVSMSNFVREVTSLGAEVKFALGKMPSISDDRLSAMRARGFASGSNSDADAFIGTKDSASVLYLTRPLEGGFSTDTANATNFRHDSSILAFVYKGETYFVYDNIDKSMNIASLLKHEIGVHALSLGRSEPEFQKILQQIETLRKMGNKQVQAARDRVPADTPAHLILEEQAGYMLEQSPSLSISQKLIAWFRDAIRKMGKALPVLQRMQWFRAIDKMSVEDIVYAAEQALKSAPQTLAQARDRGTFKADTKYSKLHESDPSNFKPDEANRENTDQLERTLRRHGQNFTITPVQVPISPAVKGHSDYKTAEKIASIFGKKVVFIRADGSFNINGVMDTSNPEDIFVDVRSEIPAHVVMGHELSHHMEIESPEIYWEFYDTMTGILRGHEQYRNQRGLDAGYTQGELTKEMIGDFMGDSFSDTSFWNLVGKENPGLIRRVANVITMWLNKLVLRSTIKGYGSEQFVTDAKAAKKALAEAVIKYASDSRGITAEDARAIMSQEAKRGFLYSQLRVAVRDLNDKIFQGSAANVKLHLMNNLGKYGIKRDELFWTGLEDFLNMPGKVSKADVLGFLDENAVVTKDVVLGGKPRVTLRDRYDFRQDNDGSWSVFDKSGELLNDGFGSAVDARDWAEEDLNTTIGRDIGDNTKFPTQVLPGGRDYKELLITLPRNDHASLPAINRNAWDKKDVRFNLEKRGGGSGLVDTKQWKATIDGEEFEITYNPHQESYVLSGGRGYRIQNAHYGSLDEAMLRAQSGEKLSGLGAPKAALRGEFKSSHYPDTPNIIAHVRLDTRDDAQGRVGTFLEEQQSDYGIAGSRDGFSSDKTELQKQQDAMEDVLYEKYGTAWRPHATTEEKLQWDDLSNKIRKAEAGVPPAPFVTSATGKGSTAHTLLSLKKTILYAIEQGHEFISWTTGSQQKERYDLSKQIRNVTYDTNGTLAAYDHSGVAVIDEHGVPENKLADYIGKGPAEELLKSTPDKNGHRHVEGEGLKVGGEWADTLYGNENGLDANGKPSLMTQAVKEVARQLGIELKVEGINIPGIDENYSGNLYGEARPNSIVEVNNGNGFRIKLADGKERGMFRYEKDANAELLRQQNIYDNGAPAIMQPGFTLTPELRSKVTSAGMPLFSMAQDIAAPHQPETNTWESRFDNWLTKSIYTMQDDLIDQKRAQKVSPPKTEASDAYMAYERYPRQVMADKDDFHDDEVTPLLNDIHDSKLDYEEVEQYAWAKHAEEYNATMKERNPTESELETLIDDTDKAKDALKASPQVVGYKALQKKLRDTKADVDDKEADASAIPIIEKRIAEAERNPEVAEFIQLSRKLISLKSATPFVGDNTWLSGMKDEEAQAIIAKAKEDGKAEDLERLSGRLHQITEGTRKLMEKSGLITKAESNGWATLWKDYVPMHRDEVSGDMPRVGQGLNVRGKESKHATGSTKEVTNIIAHVVAQREATIVRAEKVKTDRAFAEYAKENPDANFWELDVAPMKTDINPITGLAMRVVDGLYKQMPNVLTYKVDGIEHTITFNKDNETAMRLAATVKGMSSQQLGEVTLNIGKLTRFMALMNTSASPVFAARNFMRDLQTAYLNISGTEIADMKGEVFSNVHNAVRGVWNMARGDLSSEWAKHAREARDAGVMISYKDTYKNIGERAENLKKQLGNMADTPQKNLKRKAFAVWNLIEDGNMAVENGVRLAAYVAARKKGVSQAKAASLATNLTVNFTRHGSKGVEMNMWYMFMNASIQGTATMLQRLRDKRVQKAVGWVVASGFLLDILARSMAGDDDDDGKNDYDQLPSHVKENNWVFWVGGRPVTIPMPYGYNFFNNVGRQISSSMFRKNFSPGQAASELMMTGFQAFSPTGQSGSFTQLVAPTVADPFIQWGENKNFHGGPVYKEQSPYGIPRPEYQMGFKSTSAPAKWLAEAANTLSGGNQVRGGWLDFNPVLLDFSVSSLAGGAGRTYLQAFSLPIKEMQGEDIQAREVPFANIFLSAKPEYQIESDFFKNLKAVQTVEAELKLYASDREIMTGLQKGHGTELRMIGQAKFAARLLEGIHHQENMIEKQNPPNKKELLKEIADRRQKIQASFNKRYAEAAQ